LKIRPWEEYSAKRALIIPEKLKDKRVLKKCFEKRDLTPTIPATFTFSHKGGNTRQKERSSVVSLKNA
jgi:hypothetical protein